MMHEKFLDIPAIPEIRAIQPGAVDYIQLCDWPGYVNLVRTVSESLANLLENGDDITANALESATSAIETNLLLTTGLSVRDSVCGACPNVPAYIMGSPYNMRDKRRDKTGRGPLAFFIEMTGSCGLDEADMIERGAALYAMVRAISIARPLELWITTTFGRTGFMTMTAVRVETNPLDFARAATIMTRYNDIAGMGNALNTRMRSHHQSDGRAGGDIGWAYGVMSLERKYAGEILGRIISPGSQIAYMPAGLLGEDNFGDPQEWIRKMLREYSPYLLSGEDREDWEAA